VKFLVDSMLPPGTADLLCDAGHDATTPAGMGAHNLPDDHLIRLATSDGRVVVTENARDFVNASCPVLLVRKSWWPSASLAERLAGAIDRWASANDEPGAWAHWLPSDLR
jgi:hypothetical protein